MLLATMRPVFGAWSGADLAASDRPGASMTKAMAAPAAATDRVMHLTAMTNARYQRRLADQWAGDLRLPLAIIRRHADALRGADGALTDAQRQSVLVIEEQAEQLGRLLGTLESIEPPASVEQDAALQSSGAGGRTPPRSSSRMTTT